MRFFNTGLLIAAMLFTVTSAHAAIYKWVDERGAIVYSEMRPPSGTKLLETPSLIAPATSTGSSASTPASSQPATTQQDTTSVSGKSAASEERKKQIEEMCQLLRDNLNKLILSRRIYQTDEEGQRKYLSDEEREAMRIDIEARLEESCK